MHEKIYSLNVRPGTSELASVQCICLLGPKYKWLSFSRYNEILQQLKFSCVLSIFLLWDSLFLAKKIIKSLTKKT